MTNAIHRTPCLETAEVKLLLEWTESFTLDGNFILGEAPGARTLLRVRGFNSAGIATRGARASSSPSGRERRRAARPVGCRHAPLRAISREPQTSRGPHRRIAGLHYAMRWPRRNSKPSVRCAARRSTIASLRSMRIREQDELERANYFLPTGAAKPPYTLGTPEWLPYVLEEQARAAKMRVFDQSRSRNSS